MGSTWIFRGDHTLMVGMREDGFEMDRILLTMDPGYFPTALGQPRACASGCTGLRLRRRWEA